MPCARPGFTRRRSRSTGIPVARAVLFGSRARGTADEWSAVGLAIARADGIDVPVVTALRSEA